MIRYICKDIAQFARQKTGIFIFFLISLITTSLVTMYTYTQYKASGISGRNFANLKDSAVFIYPDSEFDYAEFEKQISDNEDTVKVESFAYLYSAEVSADDNNHYDQYLKFLAYPNEEKENADALNTCVYTGKGVSYEQLDSGESVCLICGSIPDYDIVIGSHKYEVCGAFDIADNIAYGMIPYSSALKNALVPTAVVVKLKGADRVNYLALSAAAVEKLQKIFPDYSVESAARESTYAGGKEFTDTNKLLALMLVLVVLTLCCLYSFIFKMRERKYAVFKICGAESREIVYMCLGEMLMLFTAAYILSSIAFYLLNKYVLYKFQPAFPFVADYKIYAAGYIAMFLMISIIFGIYASVKCRTSPHKMLAESD